MLFIARRIALWYLARLEGILVIGWKGPSVSSSAPERRSRPPDYCVCFREMQGEMHHARSYRINARFLIVQNSPSALSGDFDRSGRQAHVVSSAFDHRPQLWTHVARNQGRSGIIDDNGSAQLQRDMPP